MQYCSDKDIHRMIKTLVRSGWRYQSGRHGKLHHPSGRGFIVVPKTPSDHRSLLNLRRDIRRIGFEVSES